MKFEYLVQGEWLTVENVEKDPSSTFDRWVSADIHIHDKFQRGKIKVSHIAAILPVTGDQVDLRQIRK